MLASKDTILKVRDAQVLKQIVLIFLDDTIGSSFGNDPDQLTTGRGIHRQPCTRENNLLQISLLQLSALRYTASYVQGDLEGRHHGL